MKYSDDTDEHREANKSYANERWRQLYGLQNDWGTEGIKYLLLVNSGAAVAMLAFLGSVADARKLWWPIAMLGSFASGIVLIGFLHALRHYRVLKLFKKWRESVNDYYTDQKGWGEIFDEDVARSSRFDWTFAMAYLSFACFIIGVIIGIFNFSTLTSGGSNGSKETNITCTQANCATPTTEHDKGLGQRESNKSNAKLPTTGSDTKKEVR